MNTFGGRGDISQKSIHNSSANDLIRHNLINMKTPTKRVKYTNEILIQNMDKTPENSRRNSHMANLSNAKIEPMVNDSSFIYSANKPPVPGNRAAV